MKNPVASYGVSEGSLKKTQQAAGNISRKRFNIVFILHEAFTMVDLGQSCVCVERPRYRADKVHRLTNVRLKDAARVTE